MTAPPILVFSHGRATMKSKTPILLLLPFLLIMLLLFVSVCNVLIQSLGLIPAFGLTEPTLEYYGQALREADFLSALGVSLRISLWSSVLACFLGVLLAMALIKLKKTQSGVMYAIRLPILIPHAVAAVFTIQLLGQTGLCSRLCYALGIIEDFSQFPGLLYTPGYEGTILAYLWKEIPFVAYFVLAFMGGISSTLGEAAENLGASPLKSFLHITLPLSLPVIARAFLIIFVFAFGGYELPLLLGSTLPKALPVQAYIAYTSPDLLQRPLAMAMNGVILMLSVGMAAVYWALVRALFRKMGGGK